MFTTWNPLKMTHKQFKKANSLILLALTAILFLALLLMTVGCTTTKEVVYRTIYFADTNGVKTTIYYPKAMEKDLRLLSSLYIEPVDDDRWKYKVSEVAPDDGVAKEMKPLPTWEQWQEQKQQKWSNEYHKDNPECSLGYYK